MKQRCFPCSSPLSRLMSEDLSREYPQEAPCHDTMVLVVLQERQMVSWYLVHLQCLIYFWPFDGFLGVLLLL